MTDNTTDILSCHQDKFIKSFMLHDWADFGNNIILHFSLWFFSGNITLRWSHGGYLGTGTSNYSVGEGGTDFKVTQCPRQFPYLHWRIASRFQTQQTSGNCREQMSPAYLSTRTWYRMVLVMRPTVLPRGRGRAAGGAKWSQGQGATVRAL